MNRVLRAGGLLFLSVHGGTGELHADEFLGLPVSIDATLFEERERAGYLTVAGFTVDTIVSRQPYGFEFQATKIYIRATKHADRTD